MSKRLMLVLAIVLGALMMFPEDAFARGGGRGGGGRGGGGFRGGYRGSVRSSGRSREYRRDRSRRTSGESRDRNRERGREYERERSRERPGSQGGYHRRTEHPRAGTSFEGAPRGSVPVKAGDKDYRYHNGTFYAQRGSNYVAVHPPRGAAVTRLPYGYRHFDLHGHKYYYYHGCYYRWYAARRRYVVEDAPLDAIVYDLPDDAEEVVIGGVKYYKYDNTLYKPVYVGGQLAYKVTQL